MCWLAFGKADKVKDIFEKQSIRGLDSIGMITFEWRNHSMTVGPETPTGTVSLETYIKYIDNHITEHNVQNNVLFHHRKGSIGTGGLNNAHPYMGKKFYLMQNGTSKDMRTWGDIELIDNTKSDTYCFLQYLERHCKTLEQVASLLTICPWTIGCLFVADFQGRILFYTDKLRESFIEIVEDKIEYIASKKPEDQISEFFNTGYILFNFDGTIIKNELWVVVNERKIVTPVVYTRAAYEHDEYWHYSYANSKKYWFTSKVYRDIDVLKLLLIMSNGEMKKKMYKVFVKAYDAFELDIVKNKDYSYIARPDFKNELMSWVEYASRKWAKKYPWVIALLNIWDIDPGDATYAEIQANGWRARFDADAKAVLDSLREGKTPPELSYNLLTQKETESVLPNWLQLPFEKTEELSPAAKEHNKLQEEIDIEDSKLKEEIKIRKESNQLSIKDFATTNTIELKHDMQVMFDDGSLGKMYDSQIVLFDNKPYTVCSDMKNRYYIQVMIKSTEWIGAVEKKVNVLQTKYICLTA